MPNIEKRSITLLPWRALYPEVFPYANSSIDTQGCWKLLIVAGLAISFKK